MSDSEAHRPFLDILAHYWWLMAFRGLTITVYGVSIFAWPEITALEFIVLFSVYMFVSGILAITLGIRAQKIPLRIRTFILPGLLSVLVGLIAVTFPGLTTLALIGLVGVWSTFVGAMEVILAFQMRKVLLHGWALMFAGILSGFTGLTILACPLYIIFCDAWRVGAFSIIVGTTLIALAFRLRHVKEVVPSILRYRKV